VQVADTQTYVKTMHLIHVYNPTQVTYALSIHDSIMAVYIKLFTSFEIPHARKTMSSGNATICSSLFDQYDLIICLT
jgi:hypothetical protein